MNKKLVTDKFVELFGETGDFYFSPGRVNLIGEHTDYNGGFVLPGAIDKGMLACIKINGTDKVRAFAVDLNEYAEFGMQEDDAPEQSWARYIFGVIREIMKRGGQVKGFDTAFSGDVPLGAGLSSSAALESTYAFALNDMFKLGIDKFDLAKIGQATEHNYIGVKCGIMDQFASVFGKEGHLMEDTWDGIYVKALDTEYDLNQDGQPDVCFVKKIPVQTKPGVVYYVLSASMRLTGENAGNIQVYPNVNKKFEEKKYLYPIPEDARLINPALGQNKGWEL